MVNAYELLNREKKALALAHALEMAGCTSQEAEGGTQEEWTMATQLAGVKLPSAETRRVTVSMMRNREAGVRSVR